MNFQRIGTQADLTRSLRHATLAHPADHDAAFANLAESLLAQESAIEEDENAGQVLAAIHEDFLPGTPEYDAAAAALARGYVPGTHLFNEFFAWSMQMLMSVSH